MTVDGQTALCYRTDVKYVKVIIPIVLFAAVAFGVYWTLESDSAEFDPVVVGALESCPRAADFLGSDIRVVDHSRMEWSRAAGAGAASGIFHLEGSRAAADAHTTLEQHASRWSVTGVRLLHDGSRVDVDGCF